MDVFIQVVISGLAFIAALLPLPARTFSYLVPLRPPTARATILFAGDVMLDRTIRTTIEAKGGDFIFSCIDPTLQSADFVVANLEGPITPNPSVSAGTTPGGEFNYTFTFPLSSAALLYAHGIRLVNLGNNHIENFGRDGVVSTIAALSGAGVGYFGDPISARVEEKKLHGVRLAFINYNEFGGSASTTLTQIRSARELREVPIVYTHWGIEYATTSSARIRALAHEFVDAGAEIVVGSHPHVIEEHELYGGKYIYYSLGNFIFDQYWDDSVTHGLLLNVAFTPEGVQSVREIPIELGRDRRTCPRP